MSYPTKTHHALCETGVLELPRYFPGQLMTPNELILEQTYFRDRLRLHNRLLHGWGVVCGAIVCRVPIQKGNGRDNTGARKQREDPCPEVEGENCLDPWLVSVSPGYILSPHGDEIVIGCETIVDVRHACTTGVSGDPCPPPSDPWCSQVTVERRQGPVFLAVRYKEIMTRPVRAQPVGCGCDETACEYSRIRDGFEICTLDECPESHEGDPPREGKCELQACPPCPEEPWVVLARISLDTNGITGIPDNYSCRRVVLSHANYWCRPKEPGQDEPVKPVEMIREAQVRAIVVENTDVREEDLAEPDHLRAVRSRSAVELRGVTPSSRLGTKLKEHDMTIKDVADRPLEEFVEFALKDETERQRQIENQAREVWERAIKVEEALTAWEVNKSR